MKSIIYFILAILSLLFLASIGYAGLTLYVDAPSIDVVNDIGGMYVGLSAAGGLNFWNAIPLLIISLFAFFNFFDKNIKILFFIILILVIALDVIVLFFPDILLKIGA